MSTSESDEKRIIVPKPGQLLAELTGDRSFVDAIAPYVGQIKDHMSVHQWKTEVFGEVPSHTVGVDFPLPGTHDQTVCGGITKQDVKTALQVMGFQSDPGVKAFSQPPWEGPLGRRGVDIVFWFYRKTVLIYSIRRVKDNFFYDFASKKFSVLPVAPRAGMPTATPGKPSGFFYSTRLSGKLDDGEYVVTCRDTGANDVVIGIMALFMKDGIQESSPQQGLEDTPIEEGIPPPEDTYTLAEAQRVRSIDTD
jgi:hypothetical protein